MAAIRRTRLTVDGEGARIAVVRWDDGTASRPPALLVHGTGFSAGVWKEVAGPLTASCTVYAVDRRGHGESDAPAPGQYHFTDFALDLRAVVEALDLRAVLGVGHSAGATDLLVAAAGMASRFARIFAMEPTVMDPSRPRPAAGLSEQRRSELQRARRRRAEFDSVDAALARLSAAPAFARWSDAALRAYVEHGFEALPDGRVRLRCRPEIEAAMLGPIFEAMEQVYSGDGRGNPFTGLGAVDCPVRVSTAERSAPIYKEMAARALRLLPRATPWDFPGVGHCVAQEAPEALLRAIADFTGDGPG